MLHMCIISKEALYKPFNSHPNDCPVNLVREQVQPPDGIDQLGKNMHVLIPGYTYDIYYVQYLGSFQFVYLECGTSFTQLLQT